MSEGFRPFAWIPAAESVRRVPVLLPANQVAYAFTFSVYGKVTLEPRGEIEQVARVPFTPRLWQNMTMTKPQTRGKKSAKEAGSQNRKEKKKDEEARDKPDEKRTSK